MGLETLHKHIGIPLKAAKEKHYCLGCGKEVLATALLGYSGTDWLPDCGHSKYEVACCQKARVEPCVCALKTVCADHGTQHHGTHE